MIVRKIPVTHANERVVSCLSGRGNVSSVQRSGSSNELSCSCSLVRAAGHAVCYGSASEDLAN